MKTIAETNLQPTDYVGMSFWIISIALAASSGFFTIERFNIPDKWKTSMTVSSLVTGIAASHYFYMRKVWVNEGENPITYRYIDWILTVPLQIIEFYLILSVANKVPINLFYKLLASSVLMIVFGFLGETGIINRFLGFVLGTVFWLYIIRELFVGEAAKIRDKTKNDSVKYAFDYLKWIIIIGWSIYPIGYLLNNTGMNLLYNLGDLTNKILFCGIVWYAAKYKHKQN